MAAINVNTLLEEAKCYTCLGLSLPEAIELALLSRIAQNGAGGGGGAVWGSITGTLSSQADLQAALVELRPLVSTGNPTNIVTPAFVGQWYTDEAGPSLYQATGLTNVDWILWI